jgi:hypothetical protein
VLVLVPLMRRSYDGPGEKRNVSISISIEALHQIPYGTEDLTGGAEGVLSVDKPYLRYINPLLTFPTVNWRPPSARYWAPDTFMAAGAPFVRGHPRSRSADTSLRRLRSGLAAGVMAGVSAGVPGFLSRLRGL